MTGYCSDLYEKRPVSDHRVMRDTYGTHTVPDTRLPTSVHPIGERHQDEGQVRGSDTVYKYQHLIAHGLDKRTYLTRPSMFSLAVTFRLDQIYTREKAKEADRKGSVNKGEMA